VLSATFNNSSVISWRSVLLVDETGVSGENHRPVASHWQTWSHNVVSSTPWAGFELTTLVLLWLLLKVALSTINQPTFNRLLEI
jgi:hypothetical protein